MTATVLLIRHAAHRHLGAVLSGRSPGIALSEEGAGQAQRLGRALAAERIDRVQASPVQRARETAAAIAAAQTGVEVETVAALDEIDFGAWTGAQFDDLANDPDWRRWNEDRAAAVPPQGEGMADAQARAWDHVAATAAACPGQTVALVSHCDVIRAAVLKVLAMPLGSVHRFDVDPASVTRLAVGDWGARLLTLNERCP